MGSKVGEGSFNMGLGWGKSIPVPSVQEIVRNDSQYVPERYIKDYEDRPFLDSSATFHSNLPNNPVIDFSLLVNGDAEQLNKLDCACKEWGFFLIINHTVAEEVLSNVKAAAARFFDLSLEEKKKYSMVENDIQGYGQIQAVEEYSMEIHKVVEELLACLSLLMGMDKSGLKRAQGVVMKQLMRMNYYPPCSCPDLVDGLSPHTDGGTLTILLLDDDVTGGLHVKYEGRWIPVKPIPNSLAVNIADLTERKRSIQWVENDIQGFGQLFVVSEEQKLDWNDVLFLITSPIEYRNTGPWDCQSHSDRGTLSVLQDDDITGLQMKYEGTWIPVKPSPDSLIVVNIDDVTEAWSNGMYKSSVHRAATNANKARMSIATALYPDDEAEVGPVESMMQDRPRMYREGKAIDYIRYRLGNKLKGNAAINFLKSQNNA
ncbi:Isopenicillin N synthase [Parasponia andersonii]|uniref:Isopenicillin N synthase n=1 Tax=Parasponia andersonii TaxID=3476 RepID=A0A2P5BAK3_PARAD|nr:Isopenicillin N synthase [Parasponia andersonii]